MNDKQFVLEGCLQNVKSVTKRESRFAINLQLLFRGGKSAKSLLLMKKMC
ncbi:MAG: hypothetical protein NC254_14585 [bacterium]|nr:hypothetical protein [Clostridium sp.]MCM1539611.1 hypothetical protein [bacterium]